MKTFFLAALLLLAIAVPHAGAAEPRHPVLDALAAKGEWRLLEPVRSFGPDNLYEEIDGEAELFLPYGMERLTVAVLGRTSRPGSEVRLELYRMASPRDAYGIWSQYRYPDQEVLRIPPSEAIVSDTSADFFRGDTFVRVRSKPGDGSRSDGIGIASEIVALLPGSGAPPDEAKALDTQPGRVSGSILYQKRAMLGYECLAPGFEAKFVTDAFSGRYLLLPPAAAGGRAEGALRAGASGVSGGGSGPVRRTDPLRQPVDDVGGRMRHRRGGEDLPGSGRAAPLVLRAAGAGDLPPRPLSVDAGGATRYRAPIRQPIREGP